MNKRVERLYDAIAAGHTVLGIGPMSKNCIDAVIEIANEKKIPMILIASRRQVECAELGGGYVMDTRSFAQYVREKDKGDYVVLARDHGGPWQGNDESKLGHLQALTTACTSYYVDIDSGFDIIHLDPSLKPRPLEQIVADVRYLYRYCEQIAFSKNKEIVYEAGTEEHGGHITDTSSFEAFVQEIKKDCPKIKFVVGNMGLYVKERRNVGKFDPVQAKKFVEICNANDVYLKGHNADYLMESDVLEQHPRIGIHSLNIAPQFGTHESELILWHLRSAENYDEANRFIEIAHDSKKWEKWMIDQDATKQEKAIIAGHYVFSNPEIKDIVYPLNFYLTHSIKTEIEMTMYKLGWHDKFGPRW